jgi:hypothetical protein
MTLDKPDSQSLETTKPGLPAGDSLAVANQKSDLQPQSAEATGQLVDNKVLPALNLIDDRDASAKPPEIKPKDWTVAVDLTTSLGRGQGAEEKLTQLKSLAKETEGKSVAFVVHAEIAEAAVQSSGAQEQVIGADKTASQAAPTDTAPLTERFLIEDGKIVPLAPEKDENSGQDITSLLKDASQLAPSKHLGLILQAHGGGAPGIYTNLGAVTLDNTIGAISEGLQGSGHEKLDLLDFDSCNMGELKVLDASKNVASDVVASESVEIASAIPGAYDGQDLTKSMRALLANSQMSGRELGDEMVSQPNADLFRTGDGAATPTLANFDMTKYGDFQESLDHFGAALTKASNDGQAVDLEKEVQYTIVPETGRVDYQEHGRDIRAFTQQILNDSKAGAFGDDGGALQQSATELLASMDKMVTSHHSDLPGANDNVGGVTTPMPGKEIMDSKVLASELSPLHRLADDIADIQRNVGLDLRAKQDYVTGINVRLQSLPPGVHTEGNQDIQRVMNDRDAIGGAWNMAELTDSFNSLAKDVNAAGQGDLEKEVEAKVLPWAKSTQDAYFVNNANAEGVAPHWDQFTQSLQKAEK